MKVYYDMKCEDCHLAYEVKCTYEELQDLLKTGKCPECEGKLTRKYSVGGIKFNGTGWAGGGKMV